MENKIKILDISNELKFEDKDETSYFFLIQMGLHEIKNLKDEENKAIEKLNIELGIIYKDQMHTSFYKNATDAGKVVDEIFKKTGHVLMITHTSLYYSNNNAWWKSSDEVK